MKADWSRFKSEQDRNQTLQVQTKLLGSFSVKQFREKWLWVYITIFTKFLLLVKRKLRIGPHSVCIYHTSSTYMFIFVQIFRLLNHKLIINNYMQTIHFQFSSVTESCSTLCDPMGPSTPGLPVHHQLPEFTQSHVQ